MNRPSRTTILLSVILVIFVLIRIAGLNLPYHQDESKYVESFGIYRDAHGVNSPHPPMTELFFAVSSDLFGYSSIRLAPFLISILNLFLLFWFMRKRFGSSAALWSSALFTFSYYSVLASLMVDTDGALLPFFFLLSLAAFARWESAATKHARIIWGSVMALSLVLGMMTKLSFVLVLVAYGFEFFFRYRSNIRAVWRPVVAVLGMVVVAALVLDRTGMYDLSRTVSHAFDHVKFSGRNYLQVIIQFAKAAMYASPLLIGSALFLPRRRLADLRMFLVFLAATLLFYGVVFDFSGAALDKYLMVVIVPLAVIGGVAIQERLREPTSGRMWSGIIVAGAAILILVAALAIRQYDVPPLYPKEAWLGRIMSLQWGFLFPFTGGSGPIGFYVPWLLIGVSWLLAMGLTVAGMLRATWRRACIILLLVLGLASNAIFVEEYLFGGLYGNANRLVHQAVEYLSSSSIPTVITYNDIGGSLLRQIGKYQRRLYAAPKYEQEYLTTLQEFKGHYLVIDIPHLNPASLYGRYFVACPVVYQARSGYISSAIYDCRKAPVPAL